MDLGALFQIRSSEVAVNRDESIACRLLPDLLSRCQILEPVGKEIGMGVAEYQRTEFHHGDETTEVLDFLVWISTIENARKIE